MKKQLYALLVLCMVCSISLHAQLNLSDKLPKDPSIKIGKLSNGLTYYIKQNKKPENKVELRLAVNAGSILEDNDQQGLAHFTEHMAFNGSKHFKKNELVSYLQNLGIEFGADLNAYTSFDETIYILPVPLSDPSNLEKGLQVLQDWAGGLTMENSEIDNERGVVLEESRLGKGADDRMFKKIYPLQYAGSKYALRLPIGKDSILKTFKYDAIKRFYKEWYRPNLQAVLIVGDIDVAEAEKLVHKYFDELKNPTVIKPRTLATLSARKQSQAIVVTDKEATNFVTEVDFPFAPDKEDVTIGDYRKSILKQLFTSMLNQRYSEMAQSEKPPFLYAGANFSSFARGYEAFTAVTVAGKSGPDTSLRALLTELNRVKQYGFTEAELEQAKKQQLAYMERLYNNRDKTESSQFVDEYIRNFLTSESIPGIENEYSYYKTFLPSITLAEVNALKSIIKTDAPLFTSLQGPAGSSFKLPTNKGLEDMTKKFLMERVKPYEEKAVGTELLKEKPQAGTIIKESKNDKLGTTTLELSNGAKVVIKPTTFKSDEVILSAFHKGGASQYGPEDKYSSSYATSVVQQMGIGDYTPVELRKMLAGKVAGASPSISGLSAGVSGSSSIKDVETMLQLVYLTITQPRKDVGLFNAWKEKQKAGVEFSMSDPTNVFIDSFYNVLYQRNPLTTSAIPKPGDFDKIDLDRALAIYKELLNDATDFTYVIVGNVNVDTIKPLLATYIGGLQGSGKKAAFVDNGLRPVKGNVNMTVKKGTEPKAMIVTYYSGEVPYNEDLSMKASALAEILNLKIVDDLREKIGGIYSGGIYGSVSKNPYNNYSFVLQLPCGPEKLDTLRKAFAAEIETIKKNGPEKEDLDKVKKTWIEKYKVQLKENGFWLGVIRGMLFDGDDTERVFQYEQLVNKLTTDDIKQTANLLFDGKNVFEAILLPEK